LADELVGVERDIELRRGTWAQLVRDTVRQVRVDNLALLAGGVAFYGMLALVPALVAAVSLYGLVVTRAQVDSQIASLTTALPSSAQQLVASQLRLISAASPRGLRLSLLIALVAALWSASSGMRWLLTAVTAASGEVETRNFFKLRGLGLLLTLGAILAVGVSFGALLALPALLDRLGLEGVARLAVGMARDVALAALLATALEVLYRYGPVHPVSRVRWLSWGSCVAAVVWVLGSVGLSVYATAAPRFKAAGTYGALGAVVVLLLWLWVTAFAVIFGAVVNVQLARSRPRSRAPSPSGPAPIGKRTTSVASILGWIVHRNW
jgi:membrane protein